MSNPKPLPLGTRSKIIATLGPASGDEAMIEKLIRAGADGFRLNLSHGSHDEHRPRFAAARAVAARLGLHIPIFADLCGPKIRSGHFPGGAVELREGSQVRLTPRDLPGSESLIPVSYPPLIDDLQVGQRVMIDDGLRELRVVAKEADALLCEVVVGGPLKDRKGVNLPDTELSTPALTERDRFDLRFAVEIGVDAVALSFVRRAEDVYDLKAALRRLGAELPVIAKIEKPEALRELDAIVEASEALLVARGDLGVEMPAEEVPEIQDHIVRLGRQARRPVIVATQMLESMIHNARPTRAEVTDVAYAAASGVDSLLLSGETAVGRDPAAAVAMMDRVVRRTELRVKDTDAFASLVAGDPVARSSAEAVPRAVAGLARDLDARAILAMSKHTGRTIVEISAARPVAPIFAVSPDPRISRLHGFVWGVVPVGVTPGELDDPEALLRSLARSRGLAEVGAVGLVVSGFKPIASQSRPQIQVIPLS